MNNASLLGVVDGDGCCFVAVGGFAASGLNVNNNDDNDNTGVACLRNF